MKTHHWKWQTILATALWLGGFVPACGLCFAADNSVPADALKPSNKPAARAKRGAAGVLNVDVMVAPVAEVLVQQILVADPVNGAAEGEDPNLAQWKQQYRGMLASELEFIRHTCELTPQQRPVIKKAGNAALTLAAQQMVNRQRGGGVVIAGTDANQGPRQTIRKELDKALRQILTQEQMQRYTFEAEKRIGRRKRAAILMVVAMLDNTMSLTAAQRDNIEQKLLENWQETWETWLMLPQYGGQYFPIIPDNLLLEIFNNEQKQVWQGLQKIGLGDWDSTVIAENDEWWNGPPEK